MTKRHQRRRSSQSRRQIGTISPLGHELLEDRRMMATIDVTTFSDVINFFDGEMSLREAIIIANQNNESDVINVSQPWVFGTYALTIPGDQENSALTGDLDIGADNGNTLTIRGPIDQAVINAAGINDRVFHLLNGAQVTFENLRIRNGSVTNQDGGGIRVAANASATIVRSLISHHSATGYGGAPLCAPRAP